MVEIIYQSGSVQSSAAAQEDAVVRCVSFKQGLGAWYLNDRLMRGAQVDPESADAQQSLERIRSLSRLYLGRAIAQCSQQRADFSQCLQMLKLTDGAAS